MTGVRAAVAWPNGKVYLFDRETQTPGEAGTTYARYDFVSGQLEQRGLDIAGNWPGLRQTRPDAAVYWGYGKAYFFYGDEYLRYDAGQEGVEAAYLPPNAPRKITGNWTMPWTDRIDAAVNWGNGKIYFFRGSEYLRYDLTQDRMDDGYPLPIDGHWNGLWTDGIDAALYQGGRKAYFFKGDEYRRYDLDADNVDGSGPISSLTLDPVPDGMLTAARDLTPEQANRVMGYLIEWGKLSLSTARTPYAGDWAGGITSPSPAAHVVVAPAQIGGVNFIYMDGSTPPALIDNLDQRMLVALYRLTRWLNASEPTVTVIRHLGIGHGSGTPNDCHNQGRALDFSGVDGESQGAAFDRKIQRDWGNLPVVAGQALRLDASTDPLAYLLFLTAYRFGTYECECNGIGAANTWPPKDIGDVGGFVIHPDYVDRPPPEQQLRAAHQNHIHMQVGPTRV